MSQPKTNVPLPPLGIGPPSVGEKVSVSGQGFLSRLPYWCWTSRILGFAAVLWATSCGWIIGGGAPSGQLAFRLTWQGAADLDLHVKSPLGREIWYVDPVSASGGVLNTDCNVTIEENCAEPSETVTWSLGTAPIGMYEYWVRLMHPRGSDLPIEFVLHVFQGGSELATRRGTLNAPGTNSDRWQFTFTGSS